MPSARPQHYLTMIARDEAKTYRALRVSYYHTAKGSGWGPTAGDVGHSDSADDRLGQRIDVRDGVVRCLYCHVTRSRDFRDPPPAGGPGPAAADRAIGCERCHGPGGHHLQAIARDFKDSKGSSDFAIVNVAGAPARRPTASAPSATPSASPRRSERNPRESRLRPLSGRDVSPSAAASPRAAGPMSCMTCHDPHREAEHSASFYEAKCLNCHSAAGGVGEAVGHTPDRLSGQPGRRTA